MSYLECVYGSPGGFRTQIVDAPANQLVFQSGSYKLKVNPCSKPAVRVIVHIVVMIGILDLWK